jgi:hypothetical protein
MKLPKRLICAIACRLLVIAPWLYFALWTAPHSEALLLPSEELVAEPRIWKVTSRILALLFRPKSFRVVADIFSSAQFSSTNIEMILQRPAAAHRDQTMVWLLSAEEMEKLGKQAGPLKRAELISQPKLVVSEFNTGSFFVGSAVNVNGKNASVGLNLDLTPRRKRSLTQLTLAFSWTEADMNLANVLSIRTNASVAARIRAADGERILVLSERKGKPPVGLLIWSLRAF